MASTPIFSTKVLFVALLVTFTTGTSPQPLVWGAAALAVLGICLVQNTKAGFQHSHLEDLGALLLAAREADIHLPLEHFHVELEQARLFLGKLEEFAARKRLFTARKMRYWCERSPSK